MITVTQFSETWGKKGTQEVRTAHGKKKGQEEKCEEERKRRRGGGRIWPIQSSEKS